MAKRKVLFLIDSFDIGGALSFVSSYVRYVTQHDYAALVLGETGRKPLVTDKIKAAKLVMLPASKFLHRIKFIINFAAAYRQIVKTEKPDIIHFNLTWSTISVLFISVPPHCRKVITFYGHRSLEIQSEYGGQVSLVMKLKLGIIYFMQLLTLNLCSRIIVFSNYSSALVKRNFFANPNKVVQIPGVIFKNDYRNLPKYQPQKKTFRIINVSRFEHRKGHLNLLAATDLLIKRGLKIKLTLVGPMDTDILKVLTAYENLKLGQTVEFLHALDGPEKIKLMSTYDLFVMPSLSLETFGLTIIESLACGTPVIGTPVGAIPEILSPVDRRLIAKSSTPKSLAVAIEKYLMLTATEKTKIRSRSQKVALENYDAEVILPRLTQLYSSPN